MKKNKGASTAFRVFLALAVSVPAAAADRITVLQNANVIDVRDGKVQPRVFVVIDGNRIASVADAVPETYQNRGDARVVDLDGRYLMPGLWNNHSHLGDLLPDPGNTLDDEPLPRATIRAGRNAMDALRAGFTSLRVVGERDYIDVAWKEAFASGVFVGPRIFPSGAPITDAGSDDWLTEPANGPEEVRRLVRERVANGVDIIKIIADNMSREEIAAAVDEAHRQGLPITAHSDGEVSHIAVAAGADGIEHGNHLSDETIRLMVENKVFLDPTIVCNLSAEYIAQREKRIAMAGYHSDPAVVEGRILVAYADERSPREARIARETLVKAANAGVKIISGSDSNPIDEVGILEIEQLVFSGLSEAQALQAATINSAEMMDVDDDLGSVEVGKIADLIVLEKNPLKKISHLRSVRSVMKDGYFVNRETSEGRESFWNLYFLDQD